MIDDYVSNVFPILFWCLYLIEIDEIWVCND